MFIIPRKPKGKLNIQFRMYENILHYFDPSDKAFTFVNTVSKNMKHFTKRHIMNGEVSRKIYRTQVYPSTKYFRWSVQSHQIKNFPVTVQNVDAAIKIWGKHLNTLKGKTTGIKSNIVARYQIKVPIEILKFHREAFLTANFFCKQDPVFLDSNSETLFHGCQSPCKSKGFINIPSIQGNICIIYIKASE